MPGSRGINDNFHIEPHLSLTYDRSSIKEHNWNVITLSPTVNFGWHWIYESGFMMGFYFNAGWEFLINGELPENISPHKGGLLVGQAPGLIPGGPSLGLDFRLGYAW